MNLATVVSLSALTVCIVHALATWIVARSPGSRGLRVFSISCILGGAYAATNVALTSGSYALSRISVRFGLLCAGLHCVSWYVYTARRDGRALYRWERVVVVVGAMLALLNPIPNLLYYTNENWVHEVPALGIRYIDARSTPLGDLVFAYFAIAMAIQLARAVRRAPNSSWADRTEAIGLAALFVCGINDALVAADTIQSPYLLDIGFLSLVVLAGGGLALRFVDNARKLASAQEALITRERLAALGEMSAVVAHEVRNPVAVIFNAAASLRKLPDERDKLVAIIEEEAERLKRMANDLLAFARPTSTHVVDAQLSDIVASAIAGLREGSTKEPEVDVTTDLPAVRADVRLLRQAILNLLANALQAPGRKGRVKIGAEEQGDRVLVTVSDDGHGVPEADRASIFRPFFTTRPTGTGLGLAIVRRVVEAHDGHLAYRETPGGGATFVFDVARGEISVPVPLRASA